MFMKCSHCCLDSVGGSSQLDEWWLGGGWRAGDTSNGKINDDPFENANERGAITISKWEQWGLLLVFIPQLAHLSLPPPPQYTHLHSNVHPCPEHKESLCEVFTYPRPPATHLPAPTSGGLSLSLSPCTWCAPFAGWWTEWDEAKVHTPFLFAWRGGLAAQGPPHMCHHCCPSQLFARQFVHSFRVQTCICCHIILAALNCPPLLQLPFPIQRPGQSFRQSISITSYITCPQPKIQCQYFCMMQKQLVLWDLRRILGFPENAVCLPPPSAPWGVKPVARSSKWYHTSCRPTIQLSQFKIICRWESTIWRPHRLALHHTDPVTCFHTHAHNTHTHACTSPSLVSLTSTLRFSPEEFIF